LHAIQLAASSLDPTKNDVFFELITVEGFLFAALSISTTLASGDRFGATTWGPPWLLAVVSAVFLSAVAVAAALAWVDLFAGGAWPHQWDRRLEAIGLLLAVVAQPMISIVLAVGVVKG
jgi:hypothetical protein